MWLNRVYLNLKAPQIVKAHPVAAFNRKRNFLVFYPLYYATMYEKTYLEKKRKYYLTITDKHLQAILKMSNKSFCPEKMFTSK